MNNICLNCNKENPCTCYCHKDKKSTYPQHEYVSTVPFSGRIRNEGRGPVRVDYIMMKDGILRPTWEYRIKKFFRLL